MYKWLKSGYIPVTIALVMLLLLVTPVMADEWVGGVPVETIESGVVSGGLYHDAVFGFNYAGPNGTISDGGKTVEKVFTLPDYTEVKWARLYVAVYCGHMQNNYPANLEIQFDGDGDSSSYSQTWNEYLNTGYGFPGYGEEGPVDLNNGNRVTSDYLYWYDVKDMISDTSVKTLVKTSKPEGYTGTFDGRIKLVALVVAYEDGSTDQVYYWVNQGHDVSSYFDSYIGKTSFDISELSGVDPDSAELTIFHMASANANMWINGKSVTGTSPQGSYSGSNQWGVLDQIGKSSIDFEYEQTGGYYKLPLAFLVATEEGDPSSSGDIVISGSIVKPDLVVTSISPNAGAGDLMFANEPNMISVTVKNQGEANAGSSALAIEIDGTVYTENVSTLAPGASKTVIITHNAEYAHGVSVSVTATADSGDEVDEGDEANNALSLNLSVYDNGYKGKRWTPTLGGDMATQATFDGRYGLVYSHGDSTYKGAKWPKQTVTWSADDLLIPEGATITDARLYQSWGWNKMAEDPAPSVVFNDIDVEAPVATYKDRKNWGTYDYPYGLYVYSVTDQFDAAGNTLTITPEADNDYYLYGAYLVVVYEDPATTEKRIMINEEFDMVCSRASYSVNNEEATVYAPFSGVNTTDLAGAQVIAVLGSADEVGKSKFFFNDQEYPGFGKDYQPTPQIGFSVYDVTDALRDGTNEARLQSFDAGANGDNMYALTAILVAEKKVPAPAIDFSADETSGTAPLAVNFTATNTGGPVETWSWDFGDGGNSTEQNPTHTYSIDGVYTVNLTATGPGGSDTLTRDHYISVGEPTITVSISPEAIEFGTMKAGVDSTGSTNVTVTTTSGTGWTVTASASNDGYMRDGTGKLANAFQLANGGGEFRTMTEKFEGFMTGATGESRTDIANVKQVIEKTDAPGDYSITLTFTGVFA